MEVDTNNKLPSSGSSEHSNLEIGLFLGAVFGLGALFVQMSGAAADRNAQFIDKVKKDPVGYLTGSGDFTTRELSENGVFIAAKVLGKDEVTSLLTPCFRKVSDDLYYFNDSLLMLSSGAITEPDVIESFGKLHQDKVATDITNTKFSGVYKISCRHR